MSKKGTILIIDDRLEEKIGIFQEYLNIDGFDIKIAETLEEADKKISNLLKSNTLDGIILDFSFPINSMDASVTKDGKPNGVYLFEKYKFKITTQGVPVVINTTGDEEYKKKYLGDIKNLGTPVYNVNHQANPLAQTTNREMVRDILKIFNQRYEKRKITETIQPDRKWRKGQTFIYDENGNPIAYSR